MFQELLQVLSCHSIISLNYVSSSSIRSLIDVQDPLHHLKVLCYAVIRCPQTTPTRYLLNGEKQKALRQVIAQDKNLADTVTLCNERQWWSFMQADGDIFADKIGHLTAQLRSYPECNGRSYTVSVYGSTCRT